MKIINLPSQHQIDDIVELVFDSLLCRAIVNGVHFYRGKVKYDLEIILNDEFTTRIYNVDSLLVQKFEDLENSKV